MIGGLGLILYVVHVLGSLIFPDHIWTAPQLVTRVIFFYLGMFALLLYQTRTYGYLTEKQAGSSWLMIPASKAEKFTSMSLITLIIQPLAFVLVYLGIDALLCLVDPSAGTSIVASSSELSTNLADVSAELQEVGLSVNRLILPFVLSVFSSLAYFLLCGICFKKWKIVGAFAVLFAVQTVLLFLVGGLAQTGWFQDWVNGLDMSMESPDTAKWFINNILMYSNIVSLIIWGGLMAGIFYRIKTLKH